MELVIDYGGKKTGIEIKRSLSRSISKGFYKSIEGLQLK